MTDGLVDIGEVTDDVGGDGGLGNDVVAVAVVHLANDQGAVVEDAGNDTDVAVPASRGLEDGTDLWRIIDAVAEGASVDSPVFRIAGQGRVERAEAVWVGSAPPPSVVGTLTPRHAVVVAAGDILVDDVHILAVRGRTVVGIGIDWDILGALGEWQRAAWQDDRHAVDEASFLEVIVRDNAVGLGAVAGGKCLDGIAGFDSVDDAGGLRDREGLADGDIGRFETVRPTDEVSSELGAILDGEFPSDRIHRITFGDDVGLDAWGVAHSDVARFLDLVGAGLANFLQDRGGNVITRDGIGAGEIKRAREAGDNIELGELIGRDAIASGHGIHINARITEAILIFGASLRDHKNHRRSC